MFLLMAELWGLKHHISLNLPEHLLPTGFQVYPHINLLLLFLLIYFHYLYLVRDITPCLDCCSYLLINHQYVLSNHQYVLSQNQFLLC